MPGRAASHSRLGAVLTELGRFDEAIACHQRAIALQPNDARCCITALGRTFLLAQEPEASEASFRRAVSLDRDLAPAYGTGSRQHAAGRGAASRKVYPAANRAIAIDPDLAEAHEALAYSGQSAGEAQLQRLGAARSDPDRLLSDRIAAGFAAGGFWAMPGGTTRPFRMFAAANALHRRLLAEAGERFDPEALAREVDGVIERCTLAMFAAAAGWGNRLRACRSLSSACPRSGTSLVRQIAASHSQVFGGGERKDIFRIAGRGAGAPTATCRSKNGTWTSPGSLPIGTSPICKGWPAGRRG